MPKILRPKDATSGVTKNDPYAGAKSRKNDKSAAAHNVFKMNKDLGQHILKNPGVAQAIVDKAELKRRKKQEAKERRERLAYHFHQSDAAEGVAAASAAAKKSRVTLSSGPQSVHALQGEPRAVLGGLMY